MSAAHVIAPAFHAWRIRALKVISTFMTLYPKICVPLDLARVLHDACPTMHSMLTRIVENAACVQPLDAAGGRAGGGRRRGFTQAAQHACYSVRSAKALRRCKSGPPSAPRQAAAPQQQKRSAGTTPHSSTKRQPGEPRQQDNESSAAKQQQRRQK